MTLLLPLAAAPSPDPRAEVARIVRGAGSSFAAGMRVLPRARREAIFAVYAFCRLVDDIADGPGTPAAKREGLDAWDDEARRAAEGTPRTAVGDELARAIRDYALPAHELACIVEGMRMDADGLVAPDPARLERYIRCVAGAVGLLSMRVFGAWRGDPSRRLALSLARAMQLTNILRDIDEDAAMGRLYLPRPVLDACGIPPDPRLAARHPRLPEARRLLGLVARRQFARARAARPGHSRLRLLPALVMTGPYERLLAQMEADWSRPPARRPGWRKAADGLAAAAGGLAWR